MIQTWLNGKNNSQAKYVTGRDQLLQINPAETDFLLGLFAPSHVEYYDEQLANNDPTLEEMVTIGVQILSKNPNG